MEWFWKIPGHIYFDDEKTSSQRDGNRHIKKLTKYVTKHIPIYGFLVIIPPSGSKSRITTLLGGDVITTAKAAVIRDYESFFYIG